jgi:hypothetical protein
MEERRLYHPEWEAVKDVIGELYITQNKSLIEVIAEMKKKYFDKT